MSEPNEVFVLKRLVGDWVLIVSVHRGWLGASEAKDRHDRLITDEACQRAMLMLDVRSVRHVIERVSFFEE